MRSERSIKTVIWSILLVADSTLTERDKTGDGGYDQLTTAELKVPLSASFFLHSELATFLPPPIAGPLTHSDTEQEHCTEAQIKVCMSC